jgi:hypothetical protein
VWELNSGPWTCSGSHLLLNYITVKIFCFKYTSQMCAFLNRLID